MDYLTTVIKEWADIEKVSTIGIVSPLSVLFFFIYVFNGRPLRETIPDEWVVRTKASEFYWKRAIKKKFFTISKVDTNSKGWLIFAMMCTANMCSEITVKTQLKKCKTELQFFYCNMDKYFAIHSMYNAEVYIHVYSYYTALGAAIKSKKYS